MSHIQKIKMLRKELEKAKIYNGLVGNRQYVSYGATRVSDAGRRTYQALKKSVKPIKMAHLKYLVNNSIEE